MITDKYHETFSDYARVRAIPRVKIPALLAAFIDIIMFSSQYIVKNILKRSKAGNFAVTNSTRTRAVRA